MKSISPSKICAGYLLNHTDLVNKPLNYESYEDLYDEFTKENFIHFIK